MRFNIVTLFPEYFASSLTCGLMGKAVETGLVSFGLVNPRDFATDRHRTVDDRPYGGGPGMVMMLDPVLGAIRSIPEPGRVLYLSPRGRVFDQAMARELAAEPAVTLLCGRYEGMDERLGDLVAMEPVSVGDFVLNGGEVGASVLVEAVARLVPGFMGHAESGTDESFSEGLLEYPHYTRPEEYAGLTVPEVLLSGDHAKVAAWRRERSVETTLAARPELLAEAELGDGDMAVLRRAWRSGERVRRLGRNLYLALVHFPVVNKEGKITAVSLTNLDVHDMSRVSRSYDLGGFYVTTPLDDQRKLAERILGHWLAGPGARANPDRTEALRLVSVKADLAEAIREIEVARGVSPLVVVTSARQTGETATVTLRRVREELADRPILLVFGTGHGLAPEVLDQAWGCLRPVRWLGDYNHLPVRSAVSIYVDRLLGDIY